MLRIDVAGGLSLADIIPPNPTVHSQRQRAGETSDFLICLNTLSQSLKQSKASVMLSQTNSYNSSTNIGHSYNTPRNIRHSKRWSLF